MLSLKVWGLSAEYTLDGGYRMTGNVSFNELISDENLRKKMDSKHHLIRLSIVII